jgi:uncharacterized protein YraI
MYRKLILLSLLVIALLGVSAAQAQTSQVWNVQFYNDIFLSSSPVVNRQDFAPSLAYNWGAGAPATGVNADNFSARFGTDAFFAAGTYRFSVQADDAVRVYVDFVPVIDTLEAARPGVVLTADVTLTAGSHHVQVDYREYGGDASLFFGWAQGTGTVFPTPTAPLNTGTWFAQYFANANLTGSPTLIQGESNPSHNWGTGSPVASIPADNWSARWTSQQTLSAGTYTITASADDGVRVYVNGVLYINEFHLASANTYTATVTLPAGVHTFMIEYYEAGGIAFLSYNLSLAGSQSPPPNPTGATATVTAFRLNVRAAPDPINGAILTKISRNETYNVVGRNSNSSWWQINVNGTIGWVSGRYVNVLNSVSVPNTEGSPQPGGNPTASCPGAPTPRLVIGGRGRVTTGAGNNLRAAPAVTATRIGRIPELGAFTVLAGPSCYGTLAYWQVNYNGQIGWTAEGTLTEYWLEPT